MEVHAENPITGEHTHTNTAYLVYVALDDAGRPTPVPPLKAETEEEQQKMEQAPGTTGTKIEAEIMLVTVSASERSPQSKRATPMTSRGLSTSASRSDSNTMTEPELTQPEEKSEPKERVAHSFRNLRELVDFVAGKSLPPLTPEEGRVTEHCRFPSWRSSASRR